MSGQVIHRIFWLSVFAAIMAVGAPMVGKPASALRLVDYGRDSSVNTVLAQTLGEPGMADAITQWLRKLPGDRPILVVAPPRQMPAAITADIVSYLAWPRPVVVSTDTEESRNLMKGFRERYAAVGLCYMSAPPGVTKGKLFGPALRFVPTEPLPELERSAS